MHIPVLLEETIRVLDPKPGDFVIDGTVDGGGHAAKILEKIGPRGRFLGVDWDESMIRVLKNRFRGIRDARFISGNYRDLPEILGKLKLGRCDALLLDLGFSSEQIESSGRGFSFGRNEPLRMTYDAGREPLAAVLRRIPEHELREVIRTLGGERFAKRIAKTIVAREKVSRIHTTKELRDAILHALPRGYERGRIDPATRTFQALRMHVNDELGNLRAVLEELPQIIRPGGRVAVISFHSLEDRTVKESFRESARQGTLVILTKKPIIPSESEVRRNSRSRSAKLRAAKILKT